MSPIAYPTSIIKRDGSLTSFDQSKITAAIEKAGDATGEFGPDEAIILSGQVCKVIAHRFNGASPTVEEIQDIVEQTLITANHFGTARAYIVYREKRNQTRRDRETYIDVTSSVNEYLSRADWRVNANANQGYSLGGLILNVSGKVIANYWLSHVYPPA
ncbi:MAG: ATP cone domain-containing protein, partial [Atopobiaceae bacterium]|nr:ATP cone domain-containing protein [Atopobiaceae bacterium]